MSAPDIDLKTLPARLGHELSWTERHYLRDLVERHGITPRDRDRARHREITRDVVLGELWLGADNETETKGSADLSGAWRGKKKRLVQQVIDRLHIDDPGAIHRIVRENRRAVESSLFFMVDPGKLAQGGLCSGRAGSNER
jgi:hypothetical protein